MAFRLLTTLCVVGLMASGCGASVGSFGTGTGGSAAEVEINSDTSAYAGASLGPFEVTLSLDSQGRPSISGGLSARYQIGLGPITLYAGVQQTLELTRQRKYYLYVLWQDAAGNVQRDEYEIGKQFKVTFALEQSVQEIRGENDSVIVSVKTARAPSGSANACYDSKSTRLSVGGSAYVVYDPPYRNIVRTSAGKSYSEVGRIEPGEEMDIVAGPVCANGLRYWKIVSQRMNGWTAEGDAEDYWLAPK